MIPYRIALPVPDFTFARDVTGSPDLRPKTENHQNPTCTWA